MNLDTQFQLSISYEQLCVLRDRMKQATENLTGSPVKDRFKIDNALAVLTGYPDMHQMVAVAKQHSDNIRLLDDSHQRVREYEYPHWLGDSPKRLAYIEGEISRDLPKYCTHRPPKGVIYAARGADIETYEADAFFEDFLSRSVPMSRLSAIYQEAVLALHDRYWDTVVELEQHEKFHPEDVTHIRQQRWIVETLEEVKRVTVLYEAWNEIVEFYPDDAPSNKLPRYLVNVDDWEVEEFFKQLGTWDGRFFAYKVIKRLDNELRQ